MCVCVDEREKKQKNVLAPNLNFKVCNYLVNIFEMNANKMFVQSFWHFNCHYRRHHQVSLTTKHRRQSFSKIPSVLLLLLTLVSLGTIEFVKTELITSLHNHNLQRLVDDRPPLLDSSAASLQLASVQNYSFTSNEENDFSSFNDNPIINNRQEVDEGGGTGIEDDDEDDDQLCPRNREEAVAKGRTCLRKCNTDADCISSRKRCLCDGLCGWSCVRPDLNCDELTTLANGRVISSGNFFNSKILYECDQGYFMAGTRERICQGDSSWSDSAPVCKSRPLCGLPPSIPHAKHNEVENAQTDFELNATLTYECFNGYEVQGSTKAVCQFNNNSANWDGPDLRCIPISCGDPGEIEFGYRESTGNVFTARANYNCRDGYVLVGRAIRYCKSNGLWSGDLPTCQPVKCPQPEDPKNGRAFYDDGFTFQSNVTYQCKPGFQLFGPSNRTCQSNRQWSDIEPQCNIIDCGPPGVFPNGYIEIHSTTIGSVIQFFCFDGMIYSGEFNQSICSENGTWSPGPFPRCLAQCTVPKIDNGKVLDYQPMTILTHGQGINVTCISNYELYPDETNIFCDNGTWSQLPRCVPARCKTLPPRPKNGIVIAPKTDHGLRALFRCRDGFRLEGTNLTWCHFGSWNISSPRCIEVYCPFPGFIEHGKVLLVGHMGMYDYRPYVRRVSNNKQIIYECDRGYHIVEGAPGSTCVDGHWSPVELPICGLFSHPKLLRWNRSLRSRLPPNDNDNNNADHPDNPDHYYHYEDNGTNPDKMNSHSNRWQQQLKSASESNSPLHRPSSLSLSSDTESVQFDNFNDYSDNYDLSLSQSPLVSSILSSTIRHKRHQLKHQTSKIKSSCQNLPPEKSSMKITIYRMGHVQNQNGTNQNNGTITNSTTYPHGTRVRLICDDGFVLANLNRSIIKCAKGRWKPELPDCLPAPCITPTIENAKFYLHKTAMSSRSRGHSHAGHFTNHHHNHNHRVSMANRPLPEPELLESGQTVAHNSQIRLFCDYGFEQINSSIATLHCSYGSWDSFTRVRCLPVPCILPTIRNGKYLNPEFVPQNTKLEHGSILEQNNIDCNGGYRKRWPLETSKFIRCLYGKLEPGLPVCVPIDPLEQSSVNRLRILLNTTEPIPIVGSEPDLIQKSMVSTKIETINLDTSLNQTLNETGATTTEPPTSQPTTTQTIEPKTSNSCRSPEKIENALRYFDQLLNQPKLTLIGIAQFTKDRSDQESNSESNNMPFEYEHGTEIIFRCVAYSNRWNQPNDNTDMINDQSTSMKASDQILFDNNEGKDDREDEINGTPVVRSTWIIRCENGNWIGRSFECKEDFMQDLNAEKELKESAIEAASESESSQNSNVNSDPLFQLEQNNEDSFSSSVIATSTNRSCLIQPTNDPNNDSNVWIFLNDHQLTSPVSVPPEIRIAIRCSDIGKYQLIGPRERLCLPNGKWTEEEPICLGLSQEFDYALEKAPTILFRHQLGPIAQTPDGKLMVYPGTILHLECLWKRKYGTPNWSWTHAGRPYHQYWTTESGRDSTLEYRLTIFHAQLDDSGIYTCQTPNFHSHSVEIKVKAIHCPVLNVTDPRVRLIANSGDKLNSVVKFDCPQGTSLLGSRMITCQSTGRWSNSTPSCVITECVDLDKLVENQDNITTTTAALNLPIPSSNESKLTKPAKIVIQNGKRNVGDSVQFACPKGYGLQGPHHELICLESGKWSGPIPYCQEVKCPAPAAPTNGFMEGVKDPTTELYFASDIVQYACEAGFMLTGNPISICQENGRWSGPIPECKPACTYPGLMHGSRLISEAKFHYQINETIRFECVDGYLLKGNSLIKCVSTGRWSGSIPHCELIQSPESFD